MNQYGTAVLRPIHRWGLVLFAYCLPWSKSAVSVLIALFLIALAAEAAWNPAFRKGIVRHLGQPLLAPLLALFGVALLGVLYSDDLSGGLSVAKKFLDLPLAYLIVSVILDASRQDASGDDLSQQVLVAFVAGVVTLDIIGFLGYLGVVGNERSVLPLAPMNVHHIWFANLNALGVYAALSILLFARQRPSSAAKGVLVLSILLAVPSILLSLSRTAWLGLLVTGCVLLVLFVRRRKVVIIALLAAVIGAAMLYQFNMLVRERVNTAAKEIMIHAAGDWERETSLGDRFLMWRAAARMFIESPLLGTGTGDYAHSVESYVREGAFPERLVKYNQPHNLFFFALAVNGLIGLAALLFVFYRVLASVLPVDRYGGAGLQFSFLAIAVGVHYLVAGMTETMFRIFVLRFAFALLMAVAVRRTIQDPGRRP